MNKWIWYGVGAIALIVGGRYAYKNYLIGKLIKDGSSRDDWKSKRQF